MSSQSEFDEFVDRGINLRELWDILWARKLLIVAITLFFAICSVAYALLATEWYRAEALLAPAEQDSTPLLSGSIGGLAALAGVSLGSGDSIEALATLRSRAFARRFIDDFDLLPLFFSDDWDPKQRRWKSDDPEDQPDVRNGVEYFHDNVLRVHEDRNSALITVAVDWIDPVVAASWAEAIIDRINEERRERSLDEAETNIGYLRDELAKTNVVALQQPISRLIENEMQKLMLARGNEEFAFRVIDAPTSPKDRLWPRRGLICILGTMLGGILGVFAAFLLQAFQPRAHRVQQSNIVR